MNCASCGCSPCSCASPSFLNEPRLFNPVVSGGQFEGGIFEGPTINGGTSNGQQINGATIDCTTTGCTQVSGTCDASLATTAFVCDAINDAISDTNAAFCNAVNGCLGIVGTFCDAIETCINTIPDIISNPAAFAASARATDTIYGVTRFATLPELQNADCELAIDPCTLGAFWSAGGPNPLWTAFEAAINAALGGGGLDFCALTAGCGYAPLASPAFTGVPTAPTAAFGTSTTQIATTEFVQQQISDLNPAFCLAVTNCGGGGAVTGGAGLYAYMTFDLTVDQNGGNFASLTTVTSQGVNCTQVPYQSTATWPCVINFTFDTPLASGDYSIHWQIERLNPLAPACSNLQGGSERQWQFQTGTGFDWYLNPLILINCGGPPCSQTTRVHLSVLTLQVGLACATVQSTWPAAGAPIGAALVLADDCQAYTVDEVLSAASFGVVFATGEFQVNTGSNGPIPPPYVAGFSRGCALTAATGVVTFTTPQVDTNYSIVFGADQAGTGLMGTYQVGTKTVNGFTFEATDTTLVVNAGTVTFACVR